MQKEGPRNIGQKFKTSFDVFLITVIILKKEKKMNKLKENEIVFDMFYDFNSFEKYIENSSEILEPVPFKSYDEYGHEQAGEVAIRDKKEIKVNFKGSNEGLLDRISLKLRKKDCDYHLKDDNININRLFS